MIGQTRLENIEFLVVDNVPGAYSGIIGSNLLSFADVEYDLAHGAIRIVRPSNCENLPLAYWAKTIPYSVMDIQNQDALNPMPTGAALLNGVKITVALNTNLPISMVATNAATRAGVTPESSEAKSGRQIGDSPSWTAPFASLKLGDNEEIAHSTLRFASFKRNQTDMVLGMDFFLSHRIYVSKTRRKIYFSYNGGPIFDLSAKVVLDDGTGAAKPSLIAEDGPEPTDAEGYSRRGAAMAARQRFDLAIADFTKAIALDPQKVDYLVQRAGAENRLQEKQAALADLDHALTISPQDEQARLAHASMRLSLKDSVGAIADLDLLLSKAPKDAPVRRSAAVLYTEAGLYEKSIEQLDFWIAAHPGDSQIALNDRCWDRAKLGRDLDKALSDCNRAIAGAPKTAAFFDSRGLVHLRRGELDRAIADYNTALSLNPKAAWSLYGRSLAEAKLGKTAEAAADRAAAITIAPKLPDEAAAIGLGG